jgi:hypothetical protein
MNLPEVITEILKIPEGKNNNSVVSFNPSNHGVTAALKLQN